MHTDTDIVPSADIFTSMTCGSFWSDFISSDCRSISFSYMSVSGSYIRLSWSCFLKLPWNEQLAISAKWSTVKTTLILYQDQKDQWLWLSLLFQAFSSKQHLKTSWWCEHIQQHLMVVIVHGPMLFRLLLKALLVSEIGLSILLWPLRYFKLFVKPLPPQPCTRQPKTVLGHSTGKIEIRRK